MSFMDKLRDLNNLDLSEIDLDSIGVWPLPGRIAVLVVLVILVLAGSWYLSIKDLGARLERAQTTEQELRREFETKAHQAANLDAYREQVAELEKTFEALLAQLPSDTEVPGLLDDITEIGRGSSLTIQSIELQPERTDEYYIELPIKIVATGGYHDFGAFVSGVASLPRIVTLHDYNVRALPGGLLNLEIDAKTYRYKAQ